MAQDKKTISIKEVGYWSKQLNCKPDAIRIDKAIVGNKTSDIKDFVESHRNKQVLINADVMWSGKGVEG